MNLFKDVCETCLAALIKNKSMEIIDNKLIGELLAKAGASARLRQNLDLRTSGADGSQRMLNALFAGDAGSDSSASGEYGECAAFDGKVGGGFL